MLALVVNAAVWGTSWWPMRELQAMGLHPLWTTAFAFVVASLAIVAVRPAAPGLVLRTPVLWVLVVASGTTNAAFNWAVVIGDVVRVVLLFYLMPVWAVLLARVVLGERLTAGSLFRVGLGVAGAAIVLWPGADGPMPERDNPLADALAIVGGFSFALNNVMLRREARQPDEARALAMFAGGALIAGAAAALLASRGAAPWPPPPSAGWLLGAAGMALVFLLANLALQYGAARLTAQHTAVVMLTEVLFAAASAVLVGGERLTLGLVVGGMLIVAGAALAVQSRQTSPPSTTAT